MIYTRLYTFASKKWIANASFEIEFTHFTYRCMCSSTHNLCAPREVRRL